MRLIIAGLAAFALAGCAGQAATVSTDTTTATTDVSKGLGYANTALTVAEAALDAYRASPNPSPAVVAEATKLDAEARAALGTYGPEATEAVTAAGSLLAFLLTSAPGDGIVKSTIPVSS